MVLVLSLGGWIDKDIVHEDDDELIEIDVKDPVHQIHERRWGIRQSEGHNNELIESTAGTKSCLRNILLPDSQLVVPSPQVNLREATSSPKLVK